MSNDLKPCLCGSSAIESIRIGNDHTKSRSIKIRCRNCRLERTVSSIRKNFEWLENESIKAWNFRPIEDALLARAEEAENKMRALEHELVDRTISFMGRPIEYWVKLDAYSRANMYDKLVEEIVNLRSNKVDTNGE